MNSNNALRIAFVHPDLGIGGAERLVVDAALALKKAGHLVEIYTAHCDTSHAFEEIQRKEIAVTVWGDWLPANVFGKLHLPCAIFRMLWVSFWIWWQAAGEQRPNFIFCDQVSYCVPLLRLTGAKVLFYIHFPDKLLAKQGSWLKTCYRYPLDRLEESTTNSADLLVANSRYTAGIVRRHFPSIERAPVILNPTTFLTKPKTPLGRKLIDASITENEYFVSINRFERKKNVGLAIEAFALLAPKWRRSMHLILAGGFDSLVAENRLVWNELQQLVVDRGLVDCVTLVKNISQELKLELLSNAQALIYTPQNEHFGIVPVEAMVLTCPVVASDSGGPRETVVSGETGFLCEDSAASFSRAMNEFLEDSELSARMGRLGEARVAREFGPAAFSEKLLAIVQALVNN